jgi:hypothetical protein
MKYGRGKSDSAIVAEKLVNKAGRLAAEPAERRAEAKGNADQQTTCQHRTGKACHERWGAYDKQQGKGRRNGSPRSSITSVPIFSGWRFSN